MSARRGSRSYRDGGPGLVFIIVYVVSGELLPSVLAPVILSAACIGLRLIQRIDVASRRRSAALLVSHFLRSGREIGRSHQLLRDGTDHQRGLPFGLASFLLVRWPALGILIGFLRGDTTGWRSDPGLASTKRMYWRITWLWCELFAARLLVQARFSSQMQQLRSGLPASSWVLSSLPLSRGLAGLW